METVDVAEQHCSGEARVMVSIDGESGLPYVNGPFLRPSMGLSVYLGHVGL